MSALIAAKATTVADLLRGGQFNVPPHQRQYDWSRENIQDLLEDIVGAISENQPRYFLGSIMLIKGDTSSPATWEINDGQQRIITLSLISAFLCRIFHNRDDKSEENHILRTLFVLQEGHSETLHDTNKLSPRVTLPKNYRMDFYNLIRGHDLRANGRVTQAWKTISDFFSDSTYQQNTVQLKRIADFILNNITVVQLEVDKSLDPNAIFESLNSRGKYLNQVDLIKNYFLQTFNNDPNSNRCDTTYDNFERLYALLNNNVEAVAEYIRCYMQVKYGFINKERLLKDTKKRFGKSKNKPGDIYSLVQDIAMDERVEIFKILRRKSVNQDFLNHLTQAARKGKNIRKIDDYLLDLHGYTIARPILFALFLRYINSPANEKPRRAKFVYACAKLISSFVQRMAQAGVFKPSDYEEKFANLSKDIFSGTCSTVDQFFAKLESLDSANIISDKDYIIQMTTKHPSKRGIVVYSHMLKRIAEHQQPGSMRQPDSQVTIEHILPKSELHNSKPAWKSKFTPDQCDKFTHNLGNLTLLEKSLHSSGHAGNESFSAKKKSYQKSSFQMTKYLYENYEEWTPAAIEERCRTMVKYAAKKVWDFSF